MCCKLHPHPDVTSQGSPICPTLGMAENPSPSWEVGLVLGAQGQGSGSKEALTPLKLDLQHVWGVGRVGRITGLGVEPGRSLVLQGQGEKRGRSVALPWPTVLAAPTPGRISHPKAHPPSQTTSPIPGVHPPSQNAGPARHRRLPGAPATKGLAESANFSPQLDLIFSSNAPTAGGGMAAVKQVRQGKAGRWQRAAGQAGPARPHTAAGLIRR